MTEIEPAFGIYVHWPFCRAKCPYCDFNSHVRHGGIDEERFLAAYLTELAYFARLAPGRSVTSIFFGGGTPSLMQPSTVAAILDAIAGHWDISDEVEITLEANPTSVEADNFAGYHSAGVNRLSLGVQALDDQSLKALGRQHTADEALAALALAKRHFGRVSFDLIYAREGQIARAWRDELTLRARPRRRPPLALPAHHRGRHAVRRAPRRRHVAHAVRGRGTGAISAHAGAMRGRRPARLRSLQPCAAGIGVASQPALLARA